MSHDVFLSYSHTDSSVARELRKELKKVELTCFMAEIDIDPGEAWEEKIRSVIPNVKSVILLITPRSRDSHWLALEAGAEYGIHDDPGLQHHENQDQGPPQIALDLIKIHHVGERAEDEQPPPDPQIGTDRVFLVFARLRLRHVGSPTRDKRMQR